MMKGMILGVAVQLLLACGPGETIGTPPGPVLDAAADAADELAVDASDGGSKEVICGMPDGWIACGVDAGFVCFPPAANAPFDCAAVACAPDWPCAPRGADAALGMTEWSTP